MINFDIDIDTNDRNALLSHIEYTPAILENGEKHNSGIYVSTIPQNIMTGTAAFDYKEAEALGYFKLDLLNNNLYKSFKSQEHLDQLLEKTVKWENLRRPNFVKQLVHIGNYYDLIMKLPEPIDSIEKLGMFLAIIRPGKKHLQKKRWSEVEKTVWEKNGEGYSFKKSHGISYAIMLTAQMNLLEELGVK